MTGTDLMTANVLGALSLTLIDRINKKIEGQLGLGGIASAALLTIGVEPGIKVETLSRLLRVGQSSMVRCVQNLEDQGLVAKRQGNDRRSFELSTTAAGDRMRADLLALRQSVTMQAVGALRPDQRQLLGELVETIVQSMVDAPDDRYPICRLCDESACGPGDECPVERGACLRRAA